MISFRMDWLDLLEDIHLDNPKFLVLKDMTFN